MAQMRALDIDGLTVDYLDDGPTGAPPVLLIHGLGWDAYRLWHGTAATLAASGYRAIAPNLRGVGGTSATDARYTTALYAQDLHAICDALGLQSLPVVGFSMGASIAAALLERGASVSALCLACGGLVSTEDGAQATEAMLARAETLGADAFAAEQATAIFRPDWAKANPDSVADFKRWRAGMDQDALFRAFRSGFGGDYRAVVEPAGLPVQVIAADHDAFCDLGNMRAMAAAIPGARFDVITDCGHMAPIERPREFNAALLGFLASLEAAA
ncbi:MAG: alpha/beta fold hydrolase [Pseudomonadota bacterium]